MSAPCGIQNRLTYFPISSPMDDGCVLHFALVKCAQVRILFSCADAGDAWEHVVHTCYLFHILSSFVVFVVMTVSLIPSRLLTLSSLSLWLHIIHMTNVINFNLSVCALHTLT